MRTIGMELREGGGDTSSLVRNLHGGNPIRNVPNGNSGPDNRAGTADDVYSTIKAESDFGVLIDGSAWPNTWVYGIRLENRSYIKVQGFRVRGNQRNDTGGPLTIIGSHHIKIIRCGLSHAPVNGNAANAVSAPTAITSHRGVLRFRRWQYQFKLLVRSHDRPRSVARNDYWAGKSASAAFTNYDSVRAGGKTTSPSFGESCCSGPVCRFFNENKTITPMTPVGNSTEIVLNYRAFMPPFRLARLWHPHDKRQYHWDSNGGYWVIKGSGLTASWPRVTNLNNWKK